MPLIRLETPDDSTTSEIRSRLEAVRDQFVRDHSIDLGDDANLCPRLPDELPFIALPEQQLLAYDKHRESSELGHIFRIANGLHDFIDAVAVIGTGGGWLGAKALFTACCDPYHNELTRAARGSKPRTYFADHSMDNDQFQSLIGRLHAGGYGDTSAEKPWAVIAMEQVSPVNHSRDQVDSGFVFEYLVDLLKRTNATTTTTFPTGSGGDDDWRGRLVTSIGA
ncbi:MAG: hypothetical protein KDB00_29395, partial [Planctomycetales bacterium]|nr:hypothetical protein [Planctomycetales bacterium]